MTSRGNSHLLRDKVKKYWRSYFFYRYMWPFVAALKNLEHFHKLSPCFLHLSGKLDRGADDNILE